jgi:hypothetical protein
MDIEYDTTVFATKDMTLKEILDSLDSVVYAEEFAESSTTQNQSKKNRKTKDHSQGKLKGVGYGGGGGLFSFGAARSEEHWDNRESANNERLQAERIRHHLAILEEKFIESYTLDDGELYDLISASSLITTLKNSLKTVSITEMAKKHDLYNAIMSEYL